MEWWLGYLAVGAFAGFFAGMLGIGGGGVMVPLLVMLFDGQGIAREHLIHLAVGTAMANILFTSVSSVRAHARRGAVRWDVARGMIPGIVAGGLAGTLLAGSISTFALAVAFTIIVYAASVNILLDRAPSSARALPGAPGLFAAGFVVSGVSSLVAMGGAFMTVPFMLWCNVSIRQAIGSAAMIGFPIALVGTAGYVAIGWNAGGLPAWSLGYVFLPALACIASASVLAAPLGAAVSHRTPTRMLKRIFGVLLLALATKMLVNLW
ncbi:MAG: sulfite exporter TauE/SafE family protein [Burkholderiales bacterium]|nr:sulfite exporter TauE/SafE family protein [Burkholderiales bacterium]